MATFFRGKTNDLLVIVGGIIVIINNNSDTIPILVVNIFRSISNSRTVA